MVTKALVNRILSTVKIADVLDTYGIAYHKNQVNQKCACPFCLGKVRSLALSLDQNICYCFKCGKGGTLLNIVMEKEKLSLEEAAYFLVDKYNITIDDSDSSEDDDIDKIMMLSVMDFAQKYYTENLFETEEGRTIGLSYFHERGFSDEIIKKFQLGYSMEKGGFSKKALTHFDKKYLLNDPNTRIGTGLVKEGENGIYDQYRSRVIFPIHAVDGSVVGFTGRVLNKETKGVSQKYVNSLDSIVFTKGNELYGMSLAKDAIKTKDCCYLVEGNTDVISMVQAGIENVVASSGTALTVNQIRLIKRFTSNIVFVYDGDSAGMHAALKGIDMVLRGGLNLKIVLLPEGEDPDSFARKQSAAEFIDFIDKNSQDFLDFLLDDFNRETDSEIRKEKRESLLMSIACVPFLNKRMEYTKTVSDKLGYPVELLWRSVLEKVAQLEEEEKRNASKTAILKNEVKNPEEAALLRYMVCYGNEKMFERTDENGETLLHTIAEYILEELDIDGIKFKDEVYESIRLTIEEMVKENSEVDLHYELKNNPNPEFARVFASLVLLPYDVSKMFKNIRPNELETDVLLEEVPYAVNDYKSRIIKDKLTENYEKIKQLDSNFDPEELKKLCEERMKLDKLRKELETNCRKRIQVHTPNINKDQN